MLPDLEYSINKYIKTSAADASLVFLNETSLGKKEKHHGLLGFLSEWLGSSQHLWMWDYKSLALELEDAGFINIRRAFYGDASDTRFGEVENKARWDNCLGVECQKS